MWSPLSSTILYYTILYYTILYYTNFSGTASNGDGDADDDDDGVVVRYADHCGEGPAKAAASVSCALER